MGSERGNAAIEIALITLPIFAIMFAIIDFSMPIFLRATFRHAVREGARFGITFQTAYGQSSQSESIKRVVQENAMGFLDGSSGLAKIQVRYVEPVPPFNTAATNADGNIVEVSITDYSYTWMAPLWRTNNPLVINVASADRLETLPRGAARPAP